MFYVAHVDCCTYYTSYHPAATYADVIAAHVALRVLVADHEPPQVLIYRFDSIPNRMSKDEFNRVIEDTISAPHYIYIALPQVTRVIVDSVHILRADAYGQPHHVDTYPAAITLASQLVDKQKTPS